MATTQKKTVQPATDRLDTLREEAKARATELLATVSDMPISLNANTTAMTAMHTAIIVEQNELIILLLSALVNSAPVG